jgi:trans-aconitate 3-methyltransferase
MLGTGSAETRWRQAHPDLVGTEEDVVRKMRREIERLLWEAGVEKGKERLRGSVAAAILLFKKKASV